MKINKKVLYGLAIIIFFGIILITNNTYAAIATNPKYLGVTELMTEENPDMGYGIGDPNANGVGTPIAAKIWNIMEYTSLTSNDPTEEDIYCIKAGIGFTDVDRLAEYNIFYDMKTERAQIQAQNDVLKSLVEGTKNGVSVYNAMLAMFDLMYINDYSTPEDFDNLLAAAGIDPANFDDVKLSITDVLAVQQSALWYYTNYDDNPSLYDQTTKGDWLTYTLDGTTYNNMTDYNPTNVLPSMSVGAIKMAQADMLYDYLITEAARLAPTYETISTVTAPAKVNTTTLNYEISGADYVIGPINITEENGIPYTIDFVVSNNDLETTGYKLLDSTKTEVSNGTTVKDLVGTNFYISVPRNTAQTISIDIDINYGTSQMTLWASSTNNQEQPVVIPTREPQTVSAKLMITPVTSEFDLKLIKRIVAVNNQNVPERIEGVDVSELNVIKPDGSMATTGIYDLNKEPVLVKQGDIVTYTFRIYNEGTIDGYASEITEDIPEGLEFIWSSKTGADLDADTTLTAEEKEAVEFNQKYLWGNFVYDASGEKIVQISSDYLSKDNEPTPGANLIPAFGDNDGTKTEADLSYKEISVMLKVTAENIGGNIIRNEAAITEDTDENGDPVDDRDSDTEEWEKYEDDEDFDNIVLQSFDIALRKFITAVSADETILEDEKLLNQDGSYARAPEVDTSKLNALDADGNLITTAEYNHTKEPLLVQQGDYIVYTLRVYNEGELDGYAAEIKDFLPPELEYVDGEFNDNLGWSVSADGRTVTTRYLENTLIEKPTVGADGELVLDYADVQILCKLKDGVEVDKIITNLAEITEYQDEDKDPVTDRDSEEDNIVLPSDENLPGYKEDETGEYVPGQEDDDDFEKVVVKSFDIALRKFITAVSADETILDEDMLLNEDGSYTRAPVVDTSNLNKLDENGNKITTSEYNHTKEPLLVQPKDYIVYTLRVYNEGDIDGYAAEIKDFLPPHLEYVDGEFNDNYGWVVSEDGRTVTTRYLEDYIIEKPVMGSDGNLVLSYEEVQILCRVKEDVPTEENITNLAEITEYQDEDKDPVTDRDSEEDNIVLPEDENLPGYKDDETGEYIPGQEDDDDFEKVIVKIFDLALRKWVTQAILIENGVETVIDTGHQPYDDPEPIVKVELDRHSLDTTVLKFRYSIRIYNEGDVAGYATEITDYVPEGLKFVAEDNPGWVDEGNNVISTRLLEGTLLQPGEYADVEVLLTWINDENNMGLMVNTAEISEDDNDLDLPDIDSVPDNEVEGEDDIDTAPVLPSISTGQAQIYYVVGFTILITISIGVILIKKYVL